MIYYTKGDMFNIKAHVRVNPVNTVGVMGKGLALQFKNRYPDMFREYIKDCNSKKLRIGRPTYWVGNNEIIVNFPTKEHWRNPSKIEYIEPSLRWLREGLKKLPKEAIVTIPALGCGLGGLNWYDVKALIDKHLSDLKATIYVYKPKGY